MGTKKNPFEELENTAEEKTSDLVSLPDVSNQGGGLVNVPHGHTAIIVKQEFSPGLLNKISELENELSTIKAIQSQADAEKANLSLKKAKTLIKNISADRLQMTGVLDLKKSEIMKMEQNKTDRLVELIGVLNNGIVIFQRKEAERIKAEQNKIDDEKAAKLKAEQDEINRKAKVTELILTFGRNVLNAIASATLEDIDTKIDTLRKFTFAEETYKEKLSEVQGIKMLMLTKFEERKAQLQELALTNDETAKRQADEKIKADQKALEEKQQNAQMETMQQNADAAQNIQMEAELRGSMITKQKGISKKWTFAEEEIDMSLLPFEFHTYDKAKIKAAIAAGRTEIPGVIIFQDIINVSR